MIKLDKTLLIIDLDGTFVSVNTFHKWMKFLFSEEVKNFHLISLLKILNIAFLRLIKSISHTQMKFRILKLCEQRISPQQITHFVDTLEPYINQNILHKMQDVSARTILATAAPVLYAKAIQKKYHFDDVIATAYTHEKEWKENIKEEKKNNYLKIIEIYHLKPKEVILYSDHHDDIPLMKLSDFTYLVHPSQKTVHLVRQANIAFEVME